MLDDTLKTQLQQYMGLLRQPLRLIASLDDSAASQDMRGLLDDIVAAGNGRITLDTNGSDARRPSFLVTREGQDHGDRDAQQYLHRVRSFSSAAFRRRTVIRSGNPTALRNPSTL